MDRTKRPPVVIANWKMNKTLQETTTFIQKFVSKLNHQSSQAYIAVSFTALKTAADLVKNSPVVIGAQNVSDQPSGAFTGEISAGQLRDAGAKFVIIGHSERRKYFKETNAMINKKIKLALSSGLKTVVCCGETLEERKAGKSEQVVEEQLKEGLSGISPEQCSSIIVAYEPVWAIGTNVAATPEMVQEVHLFCRTKLAAQFGDRIADQMRIIYGGSVKPDNCLPLMQQKDIDGLLVGGASLEVNSFSEIVNFDLG